MFEYKYLNANQFAGFDKYKYSAIDTSPLSVYIMHPFWNRVVQIVPAWVAPNMLTFVGFLFTVLDFVLLSWYDYDFYAAATVTPVTNSTDAVVKDLVNASVTANMTNASVPTWCWFALSLFLFLAYTFDGIDGKQARRTGTSGPLGELFDHGLDSYSVFFIPVCLYSVFGRRDFSLPPIRMYFILWSVMFNFYTSHWEKYNTGVLFLPWGYDFGMWSGCIIFLLAGLYGTNSFKVTGPSDLTSGEMFEILIYTTGLLTNVPVSIYNVHKSYTNKTGAMRTLSEALRPAWSVLAMFAVTTLWVLRSPNDIVQAEPRLVFLLCGTLFSNLTCRLIVSQMSGERCEALCWLTAPTLIAAAVSLWRPRVELQLLYVVTVCSIAAHVHYGTCVVRQMCSHFRISCFHIKRRQD